MIIIKFLNKTLLIAFFMFNLFFLNAQSSLLATEVAAPSGLKGSDFFPLFVNAKWTWSVKGIEGVDKVTWEIPGAFILNDSSKNLSNVLAFKIVCRELNEEWYAFEHDGYICFLKNGDNEQIEKILPVNPKLEDQWTNGDYNFNVSVIEDNMVKVEYINNDASKYGYFMFVKNIGPYEKFDYEI